MIMKNNKRIIEVFKGNTEIGTIKHGTNTVFSNTAEYTGTLPVTIQASRAQNLKAYKLYGNTVQNGTPTPDSSIMPQGTGERTGNLAPPLTEWVNGYVSDSGVITPPSGVYKEKSSGYIPIKAGAAYTFSRENGFPDVAWRAIGWYAQDMTFISRAGGNNRDALSTNAPSNAVYCRLSYRTQGETTNSMLNLGSTAIPYEPYGYKIPISSASTTTPIYLGEVQKTRKIKKLVLDGTENFTFASADTNRTVCQLLLRGCKGNYGFCTHILWKSYYETSEYNRLEWTTTSGGTLFISLSNEYLESQTVNDFKTYLQQQYAEGTPVTIWYVLAESETGIVNEPLMKIGDYADTVSKEQAGLQIPTIKGANVIDADTEIPPSSVYLKWKGYK